ncbi:MAG: hypothetical protein ABI306_07265 [Caulobacteraceae bacterium]
MTGCQRQTPPTPVAATAPTPPAAAPAASPTPLPTYTLVLTWLAGDQPPATSQTIFHGADACAKARDAALAEGQRLADAATAAYAIALAKYQAVGHRYVGNTELSGDPPPAVPTVPKVAAFCAGG